MPLLEKHMSSMHNMSYEVKMQRILSHLIRALEESSFIISKTPGCASLFKRDKTLLLVY